jgi:hypothetical protein
VERVFTLLFDLASVAQGIGIPEADARAILADARTATPIVQRRIAAGHSGWIVAPGDGGAAQLTAPDGGRWVVKTIGASTDFRPSAQVGKGRETDPAGVVRHWRRLAGYLLADTAALPRVTVYRVPIANFTRWQEAGRLGTDYRVSRVALTRDLLPDTRHTP